MKRIRIAVSSYPIIPVLLLAFTCAAATASEAAPKVTVLTASAADGEFSSPFTGFGAAVSIHADTALVGIPLYLPSEDVPTPSGRVGIFTLKRSTGEWIRSGSLDVSHPRPNEQMFGSSVVLRDKDAAVGSFGAVRIYARTLQRWHVIATITSRSANRILGPVLAYDGDTLAVEVSDSGSLQTLVYVYRISHQGQVHLAVKLRAPRGDAGAFGNALALDHDTLVVGSPGGYSVSSIFPPGAAYVYSQARGTWRLTQTLTGAEATQNSDFGAAVAIQDRVILVGAPYDDLISDNDYTRAAGAVYVFCRDHHGPWYQTQRVRPTDRDEGVNSFRGFGWSLAMAGDRVAIGAPLTIDAFQSELGQTDIYRWQGRNLAFEQRLQVSAASPGFALSLWRDRLMIGVDTFVHAPINHALIVDFGRTAHP